MWKGSKLYPIAETIRLKCDALSVCIIYENQPDNRIMQVHTRAFGILAYGNITTQHPYVE